MSLDFLLRSFSEEDKPKLREKDKISLTGVLQRKRLQLTRKKGPRKASLTFSPYNLGYGFCMREKVAQLAGYHTIWIKPPTPKEQLIFDVGKKYHDILQGYFWKCGILEGLWRCREGGCDQKRLEWWGRSPKECPWCGQYKHIEYREVPLVNEQYMISGRADGILYLDYKKKEERHLVDIKSISNKGRQDNPLDPRLYFEDLNSQGPPQHHVVQLMTYQWLSGIHDAHLLYVGKNGHQMLSFHIEYNEMVLAPWLSSILQTINWSKALIDGTRQDLPDPCSSKKCECQVIICSHENNKGTRATDHS